MIQALKNKVKIRGGTHVPHFKDTNEKASVEMATPATVLLAMQQHIGAPCKPCVKVGDSVTVGQLLGDSDAFVSAPIHSSISGTVKKLTSLTMPDGKSCDAVQIESDGKAALSEDIEPPKVHDKASFLKSVRASGIVGIGGAGFPLHVKLTLKDDANVDTLLINAAECEPFITTDYREILEYPERVIHGMDLVMKYLDIKEGLIGIEDNKPAAIKILGEHLEGRSGEGRRIRVMVLPSKYPQGAEKMLIYACTGRRVPPGGLPADVNCIVMNISTVTLLCHYMNTGIPLVRKRLTITGGAVKEPGNIYVPLGTPIGDVIDFCGGYSSDPAKILMGGPMMGLAQCDDSMPILKQNNAIIALTQAETYTPRDEACIRCGHCHFACPMALTPTRIELLAKAGDAKTLKKIGVSSCMECGTCAYVCPAGRPLVQYMKYAKTVERKAASE